MSRSEENFLTISWVQTLRTGVQVEGGYKEIRTAADIQDVVDILKTLGYIPADLRVYEMKHGSLQLPTFQQEHGVPNDLAEILDHKLKEVLAVPGVAIGITASIGILPTTDPMGQFNVLGFLSE